MNVVQQLTRDEIILVPSATLKVTFILTAPCVKYSPTPSNVAPNFFHLPHRLSFQYRPKIFLHRPFISASIEMSPYDICVLFNFPFLPSKSPLNVLLSIFVPFNFPKSPPQSVTFPCIAPVLLYFPMCRPLNGLLFDLVPGLIAKAPIIFRHFQNFNFGLDDN